MSTDKTMQANEETKMEVTTATQNQLVNGTKVSESEEFVVVIENGKHKRKAKYQEMNTFPTTNREEQIWLANTLDNDEDTGNGLKDNVGKEITVADVITRKYDKVDEETGELEYGVLTYLITPEKEVFVTSSKSVYFSLINYMKLFGTPRSENYIPMILKVGKKRMTNGDSITIKLVG